jgi:hypothetical protein
MLSLILLRLHAHYPPIMLLALAPQFLTLRLNALKLKAALLRETNYTP